MRAIESLYMVIWMSILTPLVSPVTRKSTAINILRTTDPLNPTQRPDDGDNPGSATEPSSTHSPEYYTATDDSHTTDAKMTDSNERVISAATTGPVNTTDNFTMGESHADDNSSIPSFSLPLSSSTGVVPTTETAAAANSPLASGSRASGAPSAGDVLGRGRSQSDEERLLDYLFKDYNPSARPVINSSKTVPVRMQFSLMHFQELNVKSQILTSTGLLIMEWRDERLQWDPDVYKLQEIVIGARMLWVPEFAVINGADEIYGDYREFRAIVTSDGSIRWEPGGVFKTMCEIDITYFPFDEQHCALVFGAWSYHTTKMNLTNSSATINLDSYERNGEWEIISTKVTRDEFFYECCPKERFSNVAFRLHMRRRYTFYVMNVILPSMVTSILLLSIFYCPPGQKVQIGVVVLLSFRIFLLNVTDSIPKTSDHIPLLGIYLTCTMAITTLSMVLTVMVLNLHSVSERPVPYWVRVVVLRHLARLFCIGTRETELRSKTAIAVHVKRKRKTGVRMSASLVEDDAEEHMPIIAINGTVASGQGQETSFVHMRSNSYANIKMNNNTNHGEAEEEKPDYSKDWHKLAEIVDRIFFWTFLMAIVAISILLFHPLTKNYLIHRPYHT